MSSISKRRNASSTGRCFACVNRRNGESKSLSSSSISCMVSGFSVSFLSIRTNFSSISTSSAEFLNGVGIDSSSKLVCSSFSLATIVFRSDSVGWPYFKSLIWKILLRLLVEFKYPFSSSTGSSFLAIKLNAAKLFLCCRSMRINCFKSLTLGICE